MDAICNVKRNDAVCVSNLKSARPVDKAILQERPDVKIFLPFRFHFYKPKDLFQENTYRNYLGKLRLHYTFIFNTEIKIKYQNLKEINKHDKYPMQVLTILLVPMSV